MLYKSVKVAGIALVGITMIACGGGSEGPTGQPPVTPVFTSLSISPTSGNLFTVAPGNSVTFVATPRDQSGQPMSGLGAPSFSTSNAAAATVTSAGQVTAVAAGSAQITASLTSAGTTKTVIAVVTVQEAATEATVTAPQLAFNPSPVHISAGGTVTWTFATVSHNATFSEAGAPADVATMLNASASRTFPVSGTFAYLCTLHTGMTGTVVVH